MHNGRRDYKLLYATRSSYLEYILCPVVLTAHYAYLGSDLSLVSGPKLTSSVLAPQFRTGSQFTNTSSEWKQKLTSCKTSLICTFAAYHDVKTSSHRLKTHYLSICISSLNVLARKSNETAILVRQSLVKN